MKGKGLVYSQCIDYNVRSTFIIIHLIRPGPCYIHKAEGPYNGPEDIRASGGRPVRKMEGGIVAGRSTLKTA